MKKRILHLLIASFFSLNLNSQSLKAFSLPFPKWWEPVNLSVFKEAYPDVKFLSSYDNEKKDWLIIITTSNSRGKNKETKLYWCDSRFLPEDQLENKESYRKLLYKYNKKPFEPEKFTSDQINQIKAFTSKENRSNGAIDPPFFFNAIYDCESRAACESHIVTIKFLTKSINIHEKIADPLKKVSERIMNEKDDDEIKAFLSSLTRTDGFAWRTVRDTQSRSFHSIGLAIDILPKGYYQRIIYWGWQKQLRPDDWYMTPLSKRWTPPQKVIDIFHEEGFIWGGNWIVWDNMHFEYHPELLIY